MRRRLKVAVQVLWLIVLVLAAIALVLVLVNALPWSLTWDLWTVLTAVGTVGATLVALVLALRAWTQEKGATARFVSAWVTDEYEPRSDGSSYKRVAQLHVANESSQSSMQWSMSVSGGTRHRLAHWQLRHQLA